MARTLHVGYVSSEWGDNSVGREMQAVLAEHWRRGAVVSYPPKSKTKNRFLSTVCTRNAAMPSTDIGYAATRLPHATAYLPGLSCTRGGRPGRSYAMCLCRRYGMPGTDLGSMVVPGGTLWRTCAGSSLRACYAMSGTDIADGRGGVEEVGEEGGQVHYAIPLRGRYAVSGTEIAYGLCACCSVSGTGGMGRLGRGGGCSTKDQSGACYAMSGTEIAYGLRACYAMSGTET
eukprot:2416694-Rhodomonas_salina.2